MFSVFLVSLVNYNSLFSFSLGKKYDLFTLMKCTETIVWEIMGHFFDLNLSRMIWKIRN